jgi:hypothetical protein
MRRDKANTLTPSSPLFFFKMSVMDMRLLYLGTGIAGIISTISFALIPFDPGIALEGTELVETSFLLGLGFLAITLTGYSPNTHRSTRPSRSSKPNTPAIDDTR